MNFLSFAYFEALCRAGTVSKAAEQLYISQQALSDHLGRLEKELDAKLFERTNPIRLTAAGEAFRETGKECLRAREKLDRRLAQVRRTEESRLAVGVPTGQPPVLVLEFLDVFRQKCPGCSVSVTEVPSRTGALQSIPPKLNLLMGEFLGGDGVVSTAVVRDDHFVAAVHPALLDRVLGEGAEETKRALRETGDLALLRRVPFILKRAGSVVRGKEDALFQKAGFTPLSEHETGDLDLSLRLCREGRAAIYLPEFVARANLLRDYGPDGGGVECFPIAVTGQEWSLCVARRNQSPVPPAEQKFLDCAGEFYGAWRERLLGGRTD